MHARIRPWLLVLAMASLAPGCRTAAPDGPAEAERHALEQRAVALRDAVKRDGRSTPERQAEFRQLAAEVRAWQAGSGRDDLRVTEESRRATARRNDGGGGLECDDCPGYTLDGDRICFLESQGECPVDDGSDLIIGPVCVYTCLWIGSGAEPQLQGGARGG